MNPDFTPSSSNSPDSVDPALHDGSPESGLPTTTIPRDRFELLSAYMDGEVTAAERKQVEAWLATDASVQKLHSRLLALRDGFQSMPVPASATNHQATIDGVLARIDRRPKLRLLWGGVALAAGLVGAVSLLLGGEGAFQTAKQTDAPAVTETRPPRQEAILIALDKPVVTIPKVAVAAPPSETLPPDSAR
jgi:anti-sigma factor RsiW